MQTSSQHSSRQRLSQTGSALVTAMITLAVVAPLLAITVAMTNNRSTFAKRDRDWDTANAACDSALEYAFAAWKDWVKNNGGAVPLAKHLPVQASNGTQSAGAAYDGRPALSMPITNVQSLFNATKKFGGITLKRLEIQALDNSGMPIPNNSSMTADAQRSAMRSLLPLASLPRRVGRTYTYLVTAECEKTSRGNGGKVVVRSQRYIRKSDASIWQAMMFFDGDIELFPSPTMPLGGWIHTNSNAYLAHADNSNDLTISGDFTFKGSPSTISKGAHSTAQDTNGLVYGVSYLQEFNEPSWENWKAPVWNGGGYDAQVDLLPEKIEPFAKPSSQFVNNSDANPNNDSLREIIERPVDTSGDGKRTAADDTVDFASRRYYNGADIKIIVNRSLATVADRIKILDKNDNRLTNAFATNIANNVLKKNATTGLPKTKDLYDYREAGNVTSGSAPAADAPQGHITVTDIDVSQLTPLLDGYSGYTNGVVYFKDETPLGTTGVNNKKAARLQRGGTLPTIGMTFVTEDGAYVHGDYNTGSTYASTTDVAPNAEPASNNGTTPNPTQNVRPGYALKPSAICADAVMFLSNAWSDSYTAATATNGRSATATTYNTAFMAGYVPTNSGYESGSGSNVRSGGGINFPRVLEDWGGNCLTFWGSMVQMYQSQAFSTPWTPAIYGAPGRPWNFESSFLNNPPPGPLEFVEYSRGRFLRPFN